MNCADKDLVVALDLMGGDFGPSVMVPAAKQALLISQTLRLILVGNPASCEPWLKKCDLMDHQRVSFIASENDLSSDCTVGYALRHSQHSSMRICLEQLGSGACGSCVSAGNTAALMALSSHIIHTIPGVDRPALAAFIPNARSPLGRSLMLDLGANVSCSTDNLYQFACMGAREFQIVMNVTDHPKVALLNVGVEHNKGSECIKKANELLQVVEFIDFIGYIEGNSLFNSEADVIVCDGFTGNIALKTSEGLVSLIKSLVSRNMKGMWKLLKLPVGLFLKTKMGMFRPELYNGASLLGLQGVVLKSHGSSGIKATTNAIVRAQLETEAQLPAKLLKLFN